MDFKNIDWNAVIKRYTSPQAMKDLDRFLDAMPMNVGHNALIAASVACLMAASAVFFTSMETEKVSKLRTELMQVEALQPPVPVLKYTPAGSAPLKALSEKVTKTFKGIAIVPGGEDSVAISAQDTDYFPQFLAAISYLQRGGKNWKVKIDSMCVGRACPAAKLTATLKVQVISFGEPEKKEVVAEEDKK